MFYAVPQTSYFRNPFDRSPRGIRACRTPNARLQESRKWLGERDASSSRAHKSLVIEASPRADEDLSSAFHEARACTFLRLRHSYRLCTVLAFKPRRTLINTYVVLFLMSEQSSSAISKN